VRYLLVAVFVALLGVAGATDRALAGTEALAVIDDPSTVWTPLGSLLSLGEIQAVEATWPGAACNGRYVFTVVNELAINAGHVGGASVVGDRLCRIVLDSTSLGNRRYLCTAVAHEAGHLAGSEHVPGTIMDATIRMMDFAPPGCPPAPQVTPAAQVVRVRRASWGHRRAIHARQGPRRGGYCFASARPVPAQRCWVTASGVPAQRCWGYCPEEGTPGSKIHCQPRLSPSGAAVVLAAAVRQHCCRA
jgi:hypothetical protein